MNPSDWVDRLGLEPHPEGGWFRRVWTAPDSDSDGRPSGSAIQYLLEGGSASRWHRVDASELWVHTSGAPIELSVSDGSRVDTVMLGTGTLGDETPQYVVDPGLWQSASSAGDWSLVVCVVVPAFEWEGFELAPPGWDPVS